MVYRVVEVTKNFQGQSSSAIFKLNIAIKLPNPIERQPSTISTLITQPHYESGLSERIRLLLYTCYKTEKQQLSWVQPFSWTLYLFPKFKCC